MTSPRGMQLGVQKLQSTPANAATRLLLRTFWIFGTNHCSKFNYCGLKAHEQMLAVQLSCFLSSLKISFGISCSEKSHKTSVLWFCSLGPASSELTNERHVSKWILGALAWIAFSFVVCCGENHPSCFLVLWWFAKCSWFTFVSEQLHVETCHAAMQSTTAAVVHRFCHVQVVFEHSCLFDLVGLMFVLLS